MLTRSFWRGSLWSALGMVASLTAAETGPVFVISNDIDLVEVDPAIAYNSIDDNFLVVWFNDRPGNDDVRARRVGPTGALVGSAFYVAAGAGADRRYPEVAYNATENEHLVVWEHLDPAMGAGIHARRVTGAGAVVGLSDVVIRSPSTTYSANMPAVAWSFTSNKYLVVWRELTTITPAISTIFAQVVSADGSLDGGPLAVATGAADAPRRYPAVAYNRRRNEFLVVWQEYDWIDIAYAIAGRRVTGPGVPLAPLGDLVPSDTWEHKTHPALAALPNQGTEGEFLIVYNSGSFSLRGEYFEADFSDYPYGFLYLSGDGANSQRPAAASQESTRTYWVAESRPAPAPLSFESIYGFPCGGGKQLGTEQSLGGDFARSPAVATGIDPQTYLTVFDDDPLVASDRGIYGILWNPNLFADGFESGNTTAWSVP